MEQPGRTHARQHLGGVAGCAGTDESDGAAGAAGRAEALEVAGADGLERHAGFAGRCLERPSFGLGVLAVHHDEAKRVTPNQCLGDGGAARDLATSPLHAREGVPLSRRLQSALGRTTK